MFQWRLRPWRVHYVRGHISEIWRPKFSEFAPDRQPNDTPSHNFCRPDAVLDAQRTVSKHWRQIALKANAPKFMLLTIILIIISFLSPSHSLFHAENLPFLQIIPLPQPFLFFFKTDYMDSPDFYCYFCAYSFLLFIFFCFTLFSCRFSAVD